jgi:hypothetical protein
MKGYKGKADKEAFAKQLAGLARLHHPAIIPVQVRYEAFGVFGTALHKKIGNFHSSPLKMVPKTPNASYAIV